MRYRGTGLILAVVCALGQAATADSSDLCQEAAVAAARESGVPAALVRAVMTAESGRSTGNDPVRRPWPWALNIEGQGYWPETRDQAIAMIDGFLAEGRTSIDIGCFQINLRWHGSAFTSADEMIDPARNAAYAVRFLLDLRNETGSWRGAAGAYHSRNPARAESYVQRLKSVHAEIVGAAPVATVSAPPERVSFSLRRTRGSLIDTNAARGPLIRNRRLETP